MAKDPKPAQPATDYTPRPPQQVLDQIAAADALRAEMDGQPPVEEPVVDQEGQPPTASEGEPPQPEGHVPSPPAEDESWEQRYRSQAGRLEQAQRSNQALAERMAALENLIATMKVRGAEEPAQPPAEPQPRQKPKLVTEQETSEYGEELLTVIGKRAKEEYAPEFDELAERIKRLEGRVEGVGTVMEKSRTQELWSNLNSAVPAWRDINKSADFISWLAQPDVFSGRRRHDLLKEAFARHEAPRVVSFFRGFLTEAAGLPPNPQAQDPSAPPLPNGNGSEKPSLVDFAAPGRARSAPQPLPPDKPTYTTASIAKFMDDKRTGKYRGREADAEAIERDIFQAQHEGRIH
jgi:hypothetical protein